MTPEEIFKQQNSEDALLPKWAKKVCQEYAKLQSIWFGEWKDKYFKTTYPINRKMYTLKYYEHVKETNSVYGSHYNLPELYEIFTKNQITP